MKSVIWGALVAAALFAGACDAQASTINQTFAGQVAWTGSDFASQFSTSDTFQLTFTYDPSAGGPGSYPIQDLSAQFSNGVFASDRNPLYIANLGSYSTATEDHYYYAVAGEGSLVDGWNPMQMGINLAFPLGTLSGGTPPANLTQLLALLVSGEFYISYDGASRSVGGTLTIPVATTPIPAALLLFASALSGLGFFGWRGRKISIAAA